MSLAGRVAIVTGASKGIGKAVARSLAQEGARVILIARDTKTLDLAVQELSGLPGEVLGIAADATDPLSAKTVIDRTIQEFRGLDILVNNVGGVNKIAEFLELTRDDWLQTFESNVMTIVYFVQQAIPWLKQSKAGRIINIASITGVEPGMLVPDYCASKAAVINLSKHIANLLAGDGVLVNVICPGQVNTDAREQLAQYDAQMRHISLPEARAQIDAQGAARIPLGRIGNGDDVAALVSFLASDKAAWITGSCFYVDGGKHRSAF